MVLLTLISVGPGLAEEAKTTDRNLTRITLLHLNDVYEIAPLNRNTVGGLARVATLRKRLMNEQPNLFTVHAGDFLSPSALGSAKLKGKPLAGKQMVAVLKTVGIDFIILGNHEFDLKEEPFRERLKELIALNEIQELKDYPESAALRQFNDGRRALFSTNVSDVNGKQFDNVPRALIREVKARDPAHTPVRIGMLGLTMKVEKEYVRIDDPYEAVRKQLQAWQEANERPDVVIALTHQSLGEDEKLAKEFPDIDLILGGHEHVNTHRRVLPIRGQTQGGVPPIFRADSNGRTVYVHELCFNTKERRLERIDSRLEPITDALPEDPYTAAVVKEWVEIGYRALRTQGFDPDKELSVLTEDLDGREESIRYKSTNLTELIGKAMLQALPGDNPDVRLAVYNSGSIRIDDTILAGPITEYDVLRILPFSDYIDIYAVSMRGELVRRILDETGKHKGDGAFLQTSNADLDDQGKSNGRINGKEIMPDQEYLVAINGYLLDGKQKNFEFLGEPDAQKLMIKAARIDDWRKIVINHLRGMKSGRSQDGATTQKIALQFDAVEIPPVRVPKLAITEVQVPKIMTPNDGWPPLDNSNKVWVIVAIATALAALAFTTSGWVYTVRSAKSRDTPPRRFVKRFAKLLGAAEASAATFMPETISEAERQELADLANYSSAGPMLLRAWRQVQLAADATGTAVESLPSAQREVYLLLEKLHVYAVHSPHEPLPAHAQRYMHLAHQLVAAIRASAS